MNRDEFLILVCDGETLDTDTVMTEYDRLTAELDAANEERLKLRNAHAWCVDANDEDKWNRLSSENATLKVIADGLQKTINELGVERDAMRKALQRIQKLTLDRTMPPYTTMAEIYSIARDGMVGE